MVRGMSSSAALCKKSTNQSYFVSGTAEGRRLVGLLRYHFFRLGCIFRGPDGMDSV